MSMRLFISDYLKLQFQIFILITENFVFDKLARIHTHTHTHTYIYIFLHDSARLNRDSSINSCFIHNTLEHKICYQLCCLSIIQKKFSFRDIIVEVMMSR